MKFNNLTYLSDHEERSKSGHKIWKCICDCGRECLIQERNVKSGRTRSCGCLRGEPATGKSVRNMREYRIWIDMKTRCFNKNSKAFKYYGKRGIQVCDRWKGSFLNFIQDMGECPSNLTLERVDNDGNYEPANCRWASRLDQIHNRRRLKSRDV